MRTTQAKIEDLDSHQGQLVSYMQRLNREAAVAWEWLQNPENQKLFEKEVFGPPMLTCSIKDPRYSDLIQAFLQDSDFFCFTAQTVQDHKKLSHHLYDLQGLSVHIRTCSADFNSFRRPTSLEELKAFGLDGFAIDYIDGPAPVLAMFCSEKRLNSTAIGLADLTEEQYNAIIKDDRIRYFAGGKQFYTSARRAEYGAHAVSTRVQQVRHDTKFWKDTPVDMDDSVKVELQRQLADAVAKNQELRKENARLGELMETLRTEATKMRDDVVRYSACNFLGPNQLTSMTGETTISEKRTPKGTQRLASSPRQDR